MKRLFKYFVLTLLIMIVSVLALVYMMVENQATLVSSDSFARDDLSQAQFFLKNNDPRKLAAGEIAALTLQEQDITLLLNYGLNNLKGGSAIVDFNEGRADLQLSAQLPKNIFGSYLNIHLVLSQWSEFIAIESLKIGKITLPSWIADPILQRAHFELSQRVPEYKAVFAVVNGFSINDDQINIVYQWQPDLVEQIANRGRDMIMSSDDRQRLIIYARQLSVVTQDPQLAFTVSLNEVMTPMFIFAQSQLENPVEENRAAMMVMALHIMGVNISRVLGEPSGSIPAMGQHNYLLSGRSDIAEHFLVSAGLSLSAGTGLTDSIGLLKEMNDSQQGGSGFSFVDIGADRSGVRFAELVVSNVENAQAIQDLFVQGLEESDYIAEFKDLSESMSNETFSQLYGGVGQPEYNNMLEEIEFRISETKLFSEF